MKRLVTVVLLCIGFGVLASNGDFKIQPMSSNNSLEAVVNSLLGKGVILKSFTSNQTEHSNAIGSFTDPNAVLGLSKGVVLSTGSVQQIVGANTMTGMTAFANGSIVMDKGGHFPLKSFFANCGDKDLSTTLKSDRLFDAVSLEIEVIPMGNTLEFSYVFGSEEYDEYVGTQFNDGFAFYVSGEGLGEKKNLALIPETTIPVSINNVNKGNPGNTSFKAQNASYYIRNSNQVYMQYDGFTKLFTVKANVIPYKPYKIKMVIADMGDNALDSGVFIEYKSIKSYEKKYSVYFDHASTDLTRDSELILNQLLKDFDVLEKYDVQIEGHADSKGDSEINETISEKRSLAVKNYLVGQGILKNNIHTKHYGETKPCSDNSKDEGKKKNRRVEIYFIPKQEEYDALEKSKQSDLKNFFGFKQSELYQNKPNPCNAATKIPLYLAGDKGVLRVFTLKGQSVQQVAITKQGYQEVGFNCSNIPNGTYFIALYENGKVMGTKKLVVKH